MIEELGTPQLNGGGSDGAKPYYVKAWRIAKESSKLSFSRSHEIN
jgi:hypothetical protein